MKLRANKNYDGSGKHFVRSAALRVIFFLNGLTTIALSNILHGCPVYEKWGRIIKKKFIFVKRTAGW